MSKVYIVETRTYRVINEEEYRFIRHEIHGIFDDRHDAEEQYYLLKTSDDTKDYTLADMDKPPEKYNISEEDWSDVELYCEERIGSKVYLHYMEGAYVL